jgi:hypothetical protein
VAFFTLGGERAAARGRAGPRRPSERARAGSPMRGGQRPPRSPPPWRRDRHARQLPALLRRSAAMNAKPDSRPRGAPPRGRAPSRRQFLTFLLGEEVFAMDIRTVREIIQHGPMTPVPLMPASCAA